MRIGVLQLCSSDQPAENLAQMRHLIADAAAQGAEMVFTPEVSNCVSDSRQDQAARLRIEGADETLTALRDQANEVGIWILIGSLGLLTGDADGRFANRSFLINPAGEIVARYDKIHMFDVTLSETESYRESAAFRPGIRAVLSDTPFGGIGMTICYDLRFPHLHRELAKAGAKILTIPAAFSVPTGQAHWHVLLRARAIETGCFVIAPAQSGSHPGSNRKTYGHSLVVDPWGKVLLDAGTEPGLHVIDIDLTQVDHHRGRVPALTHDREFSIIRAGDDG